MPGCPPATLSCAVVAAVAVAACGGASRVGTFNDTVVYGGLWFADESCARQFAAPRLIRANEMKEFERCVATLALRPGERKHAMWDGEVFVYGPGLEVKARYLDTLTAGRLLVAIGFVGDPRPTISPSTFASLRIGGEDIDDATRAQVEGAIVPPFKRALMFVRVCVDDTGGVTSATPLVSTSLMLVGVLDRAIETWRFKPFQWQGKARGICSVVELVHPADRVQNQFLPLSTREAPYPAVTRLELRGELRPKLSDSMEEALMRTRPQVMGAVRFCIDEAGKLISADIIEPSGSRAYDDAMLETVRGWTISPYLLDGKPVRVCSYAGYGVRWITSAPMRPPRR